MNMNKMVKYRIGISENREIGVTSVKSKNLAFGGTMKVSAPRKVF